MWDRTFATEGWSCALSLPQSDLSCPHQCCYRDFSRFLDGPDDLTYPAGCRATCLRGPGMAKHQLRQLSKGLITQGQLHGIKGTQLSRSVQNSPCVALVVRPSPGSLQIWSRGKCLWLLLTRAKEFPSSVAAHMGMGLSPVAFTGFQKNAPAGLHYASSESRFLFSENLWKLRWREKSFNFTEKSYKSHRFPAAE